MEDNNCVNDTIEINWEDAPEGTTHYDPRIGYAEWKKYLGEGVWYYYSTPLEGGGSCWKDTGYLSDEEHRFIPKPEQTTETTCTEDSYTNPKEDPFSASLNKSSPSQISLADYIESIVANVDQEPTGCSGTVDFVEESLRHLNEWANEAYDISSEKDSNVSWYDYDTEELTGLPEKGETVYDRSTNQNVEFLGSPTLTNSCLLDDGEGGCWISSLYCIKPLNYKDSPTRQAREEQHKLLEDLVGHVDSNLQGHTHKAGAIELYNKGWRVSKEDV